MLPPKAIYEPVRLAKLAEDNERKAKGGVGRAPSDAARSKQTNVGAKHPKQGVAQSKR